MSKIRTRFAPSPTGRMHVGNLRTALYAYLITKHEGGDFILRIEDTDQERYVEGAVEIINRTLEKTGLIHDEGPDKDKGCGPYVQSERQASGIYLEYAKKLIEKGEAYYCFCDKERLDSLRTEVGGKEISVYDKHCLHLSKEEVESNLAAGKPYVIRQNNPTEGTTTFHDDIYGDITVDNAELDLATAGSFNAGTHVFSFANAPVKGVGNVEITYDTDAAVAEENRMRIVRMMLVEAYNGSTDTRLFVAGDGSNICYYSGVTQNGDATPMYFPAMNEIAVDMTSIV